MNSFDQWSYDTAHVIFGDGVVAQFIQGLGHFADYAVTAVLVTLIISVLYSEKQYIKAMYYIICLLAILIILETIKALTGISSTPRPYQRYFEYDKPVTGTALGAYVMGAIAIKAGNRIFNIVLCVVVCFLGISGRVYIGNNYATEAVIGWSITIPIIFVFAYLNNKAEKPKVLVAPKVLVPPVITKPPV